MASSPHSVFNVFVYGSLFADDIVRALLKRVPPSNPAILHNYHRFNIKGPVYPAILPVENRRVNGKDSSKTLQIEIYVWINKRDPDLYWEWDFEKWKVLHKGDFLKMTTGFSEEMELPESKTRVATYESFYALEGIENVQALMCSCS